MKAIVLAAAKSIKLSPFSDTRPKSMMFFSGRYILESILIQLSEAGVTEVWIVVNHKKEMIQKFFQYGKSLGLKLNYIFQPEELGIGQALSLCEDAIGDDKNFLLVYGDALMSGNPFIPLIERLELTEAKSLATITHPSSEGYYGNIYLSHNMEITKLLEKPSGSRISNYIFGGSFVLSHDCFKFLKDNDNDIVSLYQNLIKNKELEASLWEDNWIDISRPWYILAANQLMTEPWDCSIIPQTVEMDSNVQISGVVHIAKNAKIGSGTKIVGPCYIGENVFIGNNTLIRENTSIGPNSIIGYGTEIKNSVLFGNDIIGRLSYIGDSVIGENVNLGSGIVTVNYNPKNIGISCHLNESEPINTDLNKLGVFIGDNSIIGSGHKIAPGTMIPPNFTIADNVSIDQSFIESKQKK